MWIPIAGSVKNSVLLTTNHIKADDRRRSEGAGGRTALSVDEEFAGK